MASVNKGVLNEILTSYKTKATIEQAKQLAGFVLLFGGDVMTIPSEDCFVFLTVDNGNYVLLTTTSRAYYKLSYLEEIDVNQLLSKFQNQMGVNHVRP